MGTQPAAGVLAQVIDLSGAAELHATHRDWLNDIASYARRPYTDLALRLSKPHADAIDWWVTPLASRNIFACALFQRCCHLLLALRVAEAGGPLREIIVETPALARALRKALAARNARISVRTRVTAPWFHARLFAGMCRRLAAAGFHAFNQMLFSRLTGPARPSPDVPVVLIDTFVYRDSFERGYRDRYYPGLIECLTAEERRGVYFLPTYYKIRNYLRLFRALRASIVNFLVKEDYLRPGDYAHALGHPLRSLRYTVDTALFEGHEIGAMVNETVYETFASSGSIEGLLRYRLARRLRDAGLAVRLVVDWFENQEVDHGSNAGFRRFMPQTPIVGYQGFVVSNHYLCAFPTADEKRLELIPQRVAVLGSALTERPKEFCPDLAVGVGPAFRFAGLWRERKAPELSTRFRILVALPLMEKESGAMLELLTLAAHEFPADGSGPSWHTRVKAHPAFAKRLPGHFERVEDDFDDLLDECDVLVSAASSVCVQALAHGVPVIVLGDSHGITLNPIPDDFDHEMWAVCYTAQELIAALSAYTRRDAATLARHRAEGLALRDRYFTPVTRETVREFLLLDAVADRTIPAG